MTAEELNAFLKEQFPQMNGWGQHFLVESVAADAVRLRMTFNDKMLRPGGTVSGPAMFALADVAMYAVVLAHVGPRALAVTTNLNINFLRKPAPGDIVGDARLLKLGKRLAYGEIAIRSDGEEEIAAHATATYSIPDG
ncbi:MAG: PaaI family thioesterase [Rhodomicrobium sp.]|nr:PaaI family thioesterase [Rhodomicrobium sp.]